MVLSERDADECEREFWLLKDGFVPKSEDSEPASCEEIIAPGVVTAGAFGVVNRAVDLDHEPCVATEEVGNVWSDRMLAPELGAEGASPQHRPECALSWGSVSTLNAGQVGLLTQQLGHSAASARSPQRLRAPFNRESAAAMRGRCDRRAPKNRRLASTRKRLSVIARSAEKGGQATSSVATNALTADLETSPSLCFERWSPGCG